MSIDYGKKLREIRKAEKLTQKSMSDITGIALSAIRNYETQDVSVGISIVERVLAVDIFRKYTLWLMTDTTAPEAGQVSPALAHYGPEKEISYRSNQKIG
ncbi:helix-turn-helix domain-containing protein [Xenorhabdus bovienii]|uniref:helix-turn-helix domain-containing protein n=1 Tax=Xenorhabdus bovienii TaxID=40576 RepID=UPI00237CBA50|nr:helix-turn-helix transcriptional regulator [Xenorhabdus bovienii]MDE1489869.1 helix-turn-helix domain-containing protein [Xenorhabdus bovienii]